MNLEPAFDPLASLRVTNWKCFNCGGSGVAHSETEKPELSGQCPYCGGLIKGKNQITWN